MKLVGEAGRQWKQTQEEILHKN